MIIKKTWTKYPKFHPNSYYNYTGFFLLGLIPIYIDRKEIDRY